MFFLLNPLYIGLVPENSTVAPNNNFERNEDYKLFNQVNSRTESLIIDLNTKTDEIHHNITIYGEEWNCEAGYAMVSGDINGDSIGDVIISICSRYHQYYGKTYLIFGKLTPSPIVDLNSPDVLFYGDDYGDFMGQEALATGDVNGDGIDDLLLSAIGGDGAGDLKGGCGEVYIVYGNKSLPSTWKFSITPANVTIYGVDLYDGIGSSMATGDINGDGIDDIIIGATNGDGPNNQRTGASWLPGCGEVYVIYGNASLPSSIDLTASANMTIYGADASDNLGCSVATGDINSDNYDDIIIGATYADGVNNLKSNCGEVYVIYGNISSSLPSMIDLLNTSANITIYGEGYLGQRLTTGDLNNDNIDDLIISSSSKIYMINGNNSFLSNISINASEADSIIYNSITGNVGGRVATGYINDDDYDDLIIGGYGNGPNEFRPSCGGAYVIYSNGSLLSNIDMASFTPNITIYGADTRNYGGDSADGAGSSALITDFNGDNKSDLILAALGGDGRHNENEDSGEVYVILSGGNVLPIPVIDSIELVNGDGEDKKTCYSRYSFPYNFRIGIITPNNLDEISRVTLSLSCGSTNKLQYRWFKTTEKFTETHDPGEYTELNDKSSFKNNGKKYWTIDFYLKFNWTYPNNDLHNVQVETLGYTGLIDQLELINDIYRVETRLNFTGNVTVTGASHGVLSEGAWIRGGEQLTWGGLKVIYENTEDLYPPNNANVTITVKDSQASAWMVNQSPGKTISIITNANNNTRLNETYSVTITNVPAECDKSNITFKLNIDGDIVTFSDSYPDNKSWQTTLRPQCGIKITDPTTNVDSSSIQYRLSTDNGINWLNWTDMGIQKIMDKRSVFCSIKPIFKEGNNNLIQWRAQDIVDNNYNESDQFRILVDITNVTFIDPKPTADAWQNNLSVACNITVIDPLSGVNASSIEFSTSTTGPWDFGIWQSAQEIVNEEIVHCSVTPTFIEGIHNYIRWRAKDMVNGYHISENYQIRIKLNHPPITTLQSPKNDTIIDILTPKLVWEGSDTDNNTQLKYSIFLSHEKDEVVNLNKSALIKSNYENITYRIETPLVDRNTYYWTVIPTDGISSGICISDVWHFTIDTAVEIPIVTLSEPSNNSNVTTTTPKLTWQLNYSNVEIVTFNIYISKSPIPTKFIDKKNMIVEEYKLTTFIVEPPLIPGETYYWSVLPSAKLSEGIFHGICKSGIWGFRVELPKENVYGLNMSIEYQNLNVAQGNYTFNTITVTNTGNIADMISLQINKGILDATVAFNGSGNLLRLDISEKYTLQLEILVSYDAIPQNYTISITARSNNALSKGQEVSVTKAFKLQVTERKKEIIDDETKKDDEKSGITNLDLWIIIGVILILFLALFLYVHRVSKARKIPLVKSELLSKPPEHLALPGISTKAEKEFGLPAVGAAGPLLSGESLEAPSLGAQSIPTQYQLPRAILTKEQKLELLDERFLLGEVTEETYKELKEKLESGKEKDITAEEGEAPVDETTEPVKAEDVPVPEAEVPPVTEDIEAKEEEELEKVEEETKEPEEIEAKEMETTLETTGELEEESKKEPIQPPVTPMGKGELPVKKKKKTRKKKKVRERKGEDLAMKEQKIDKEVYDQELQKEHEAPDDLPWNDGECVKCGESLKLHSEYCWNCGTKYKVRKR